MCNKYPYSIVSYSSLLVSLLFGSDSKFDILFNFNPYCDELLFAL